MKKTKVGFDNDKYVKIQSKKIKERIKKFGKLYLEIGGKLMDDYHASRVLPEFDPNVKIKMLEELKDILEFVFVINANDIENKRIRADYNITYETYLLKTIDDFNKLGFKTSSVVITLYNNQKGIKEFRKKIESNHIKTYLHTFTKGYPTDIDTIVSDEGYGANAYIETERPLVVVTAPGANSGKLATCLSQLYHEYRKGKKAGYAKFETFPVWSLPLKHPVNMAYEAATADINDVNMIDSFHLEKYGITAINYNRDIMMFPVLKNILYKITNSNIYYSPTDMGVNVIGECIIDNKVVENASKDEIIRRYYQALCDNCKKGQDIEVANRIKILMNELKITELDRDVVSPCLAKAQKEGLHVISLKLPNGKIITGKESKLLSASSALILNSIKELTKIPDNVDLLAKSVLDPIMKYKPISFTIDNHNLQLQDVLIALSICSVTNPIIEKAIDNLNLLAGCEAHASYIVSHTEKSILRNIKINLTCEPELYSNNLFNE